MGLFTLLEVILPCLPLPLGEVVELLLGLLSILAAGYKSMK